MEAAREAVTDSMLGMAGTVNALVRDNLADGSSADEQLEFMQDRGFQAELLGLCKKARQVQPRDYIASNKSIAARTWHKSFEHAYRAVSEATLTTVAFKTGVTACSPLLMAVASINNLTKSHYKVVKRRSGCGKVQFTCKGFHCDNTYQGSQMGRPKRYTGFWHPRRDVYLRQQAGRCHQFCSAGSPTCRAFSA